MQGRVACEINTADELLAAELMLNGTFNSLDKHQLVAMVSCLIQVEKSNVSRWRGGAAGSSHGVGMPAYVEGGQGRGMLAGPTRALVRAGAGGASPRVQDGPHPKPFLLPAMSSPVHCSPGKLSHTHIPCPRPPRNKYG